MITGFLRAILALVILMASAACATDPDRTDQPRESDLFDEVRAANARRMPPNGPFPEGRPGPAGGITFIPSSAAIEHAVPYTFSLGHCGLQSPVDVDGSFWDAIDGVTPTGQPLDLAADTEMINATTGVIVVIADEARFRTESGSVVRFARHAGEKEVPACM